MLRITPSTSPDGAKKYFTQSLTRDDTGYYHEGEELAGAWGGKGAQMLGREGAVSQKAYFALCDNRNPETGERITPRNKEGRRVGYDFTFSAPKSVSVLYELTGDERILDAHRESIRETMVDIEREMKTRVRIRGADYDRETGNMVYAEFTHFTARPVTGKEDGVSKPDPHLHSHLYCFNLTKDEVENRWKAGQFGDLKRDGQFWEASYDARFAHRLQTMGIPTEKRGLSFEIAGTPQSLIDKNSRRRNEIEDKAAEKGIADTKGKHDIGYYGREKKNTGLTKAELRKEWDSRLSDDERSALADAIHGRTKGDRAYSPDEAKKYALTHPFERASAVSEKKLKAEALKYGVGSILPEDVADIAQHPEAIPVRHDGQLMLTTKTVLNNEVAFLQFAKDGRGKFRPFLAEVPNELLAGLTAEQRKAGSQILSSRDQIAALSGKAGVGKTHLMRTVRDAIESVAGRHVFAFAPSSQASRGVLAREGFKDATTVEALLESPKMQAQTKGQVIWIDEAGLVSSKDMRRVTDLAKRNGNRLILSGDYTQHNSVSAGDAFRLLEKEGGVRFARLTQIRRQTAPGYKKAVEAIAEGTGKAAQKGFDALDKMGCVIEASGSEQHSLLVADYLKAVEDGKSALIVVPTHSEAGKLTDELRGALRERGALGEERQFVARKSTGWTDAQKSDARNYEPGMVVEFHQNAKGFARAEKCVVARDDNGVYLQKTDGSRAPLPVVQANRFDVFRTREIAIARGDRIRITKNGEAKVEGQAKGTRLNNGDIFTVEGFNKDGDIQLEKGRLLPKNWGHLSLGYTDTSYAVQGKTSDRVFISVGDESLPAVNRQGWYVAASRGREQAKIYVDSKEGVRNAIARTGERLSAVELTKTKLRPSWRSRFYESLERNRVGRFLKQRAAAVADRWRGKEIGYA